ncbi:MAG: urease accessory protein UreD [Myxococcota bacterium]
MLRRHHGPLRVQKHFEPEPGLCQHIIVHPPAGMAGGDRLTLAIEVGPGAHAQLTTPGATPWYRAAVAASPALSVAAAAPSAESPAARQSVSAKVLAGGVLELLPREHILFDGAHAALDATLDLAADARAIVWETLVLGRAHGDRPFLDGHLDLAARIVVGGELRLADRLRLDARDPMRRSPLGLAGASVMASVFLVGPDLAPATVAAVRALATPCRAGLTQLPGVAVGRWLGAAVEPARQWLEAVWSLTRPDLLGRAAVPPRIWRT